MVAKQRAIDCSIARRWLQKGLPRRRTEPTTQLLGTDFCCCHKTTRLDAEFMEKRHYTDSSLQGIIIFGAWSLEQSLPGWLIRRCDTSSRAPWGDLARPRGHSGDHHPDHTGASAA